MVRVASFRNQLWIAAMLAAIWIPATAQAPASAVQAQSAVIRVTSPRPAQRQTDNFVTVHYELQNPTAAVGRLSQFPGAIGRERPHTTTTSTEQSFTGLTAGPHVITVRLVDANGTAIPDSQTQVQFVVIPTAQNGGAITQAPATPGNQTATPAPQAQNAGCGRQQVQTAAVLPDGSLLPVAGIVGFSFLFGGIVCGALKKPRNLDASDKAPRP